jgi:putative Mn2+ efflux pump MntP
MAKEGRSTLIVVAVPLALALRLRKTAVGMRLAIQAVGQNISPLAWLLGASAIANVITMIGEAAQASLPKPEAPRYARCRRHV